LYQKLEILLIRETKNKTQPVKDMFPTKLFWNHDSLNSWNYYLPIHIRVRKVNSLLKKERLKSHCQSLGGCEECFLFTIKRENVCNLMDKWVYQGCNHNDWFLSQHNFEIYLQIKIIYVYSYFDVNHDQTTHNFVSILSRAIDQQV
jgi:hypothetical protein